MKVSRVNSLRSAIFTVPLFAMALNVAMAAPQTGNRSTSPNNSITAEQIAAAQNKVATALAIANRFTAQSVAGSGGPDPNRVQLINNLLTGDAKGLEEAGAAANLHDALAAASTGAARRASSSGPRGSTNPVSPSAASSATSDLVYTPITPCRILDTRGTGGGGLFDIGSPTNYETRTYDSAPTGGAQGSDSSCQSYTGAIPAAVVLNVATDSTPVTQGTNALFGYLSVYPANAAVADNVTDPHDTAWLNYSAGGTVSNEGVAGLDQSNGRFKVKAQNPTHVIIDMYGYFRAPTSPVGSMAFMSSVGAGTVTTTILGLVGTVAVLPVSGAEASTPPSISLLGGALNVSTNTALLTQAQTWPQSGTFSTMKATFMETAGLSLIGSTVTLTASLYSGPLTNLTPTGLSCSVTLSGAITLGNIQTCSTSTGTATVNAGDSGFIVISASATGLSLLNTVAFGASVGIAP